MLECYLHNFKTYDIWEFDRHCYETKHTLTIWTKDKGERTIPYPKDYYQKQHYYDPIHRMNLAVGMYIEDNKRKKKKK